jgi:metal-responsive CopG/Arc/MetJ family transcriptional regulator
VKRGKYSGARKRNALLVTAWVPRELVQAIDVVVALEDSDRSKFLRNAIRERAARYGIRIEETVL